MIDCCIKAGNYDNSGRRIQSKNKIENAVGSIDYSFGYISETKVMAISSAN